MAQESWDVEDLGISERNSGSLKAKRLSEPLKGDKSYRRCEREQGPGSHTHFSICFSFSNSLTGLMGFPLRIKSET